MRQRSRRPKSIVSFNSSSEFRGRPRFPAPLGPHSDFRRREVSMLAILIFSYLFGIFGQLADTWTTHRGLITGGIEGNPISAAIIKKIGIIGLGAVKIGLAAILPFVGFWFLKSDGYQNYGFYLVGFVYGSLGWLLAVINWRTIKAAGKV